MRSILLTAIYCLVGFVGYAQQYKSDDFIESIPKKYPAKEWLELNRAPLSFKVSFVNRRLVIEKDNERRGPIHFKANNGELIGINNGEWGGALLHRTGIGKVDTVKSGNIVQIFTFKNQIYFIQGLAHMSFNSGDLYKLNEVGNKFTYTKVITFEDAPESCTVFKDKILIAGFSNFYTVQGTKQQTIFKDMFWWSLYPNSIALLSDNEAYVGMRGGYVRLNILNKTFKFYRYKYLPKVIDP